MTDDDEGDRRPSGGGDGQPEAFHKFKHMELPREVVVGHNAIERTREVIRRLGLTNVAISTHFVGSFCAGVFGHVLFLLLG